MATTSFPAVGNGGLTSANWSKMYTCPDGIVNDTTGSAFAITLVSASNIARLSAGTACVNGYFLNNDGEFDVAVPTGAGTYNIAVMYDPTLNVADGSGDAVPAGPCRIVIATTLDTSGGRQYTLLYQIVRASGQALSAATVRKLGQHVGPNISIPAMPAAALTVPPGVITGFEHPVGTLIFEESTREHYRLVPHSNGSLYWQRQSSDGPFALPSHSLLVAGQPNEAATYHLTDNRSRVVFEGTLKRSSNGNLVVNGTDVILGTMPVGLRPLKQLRFPCTVKLSVGWDVQTVTVRPDGVFVLYDPVGSPIIDFLDLSAISYRVR